MKISLIQKVESDRAQVFLIDDQGKMGQAAAWVIGGSKDKPALAAMLFQFENSRVLLNF